VLFSKHDVMTTSDRKTPGSTDAPLDGALALSRSGAAPGQRGKQPGTERHPDLAGSQDFY
jgi:hypothetical protein